jgi:hypothetical protein
MAYMIIHLKVKNYDQWKKEFDAFSDLRTASGEQHHVIYREASDPLLITAMFKWDSIENAQKYANSPELKAGMEKAGVTGPPSIHFLNEA